MLLFLTLFFIIFSIWCILFILNSLFNSLFLILGVLVSIFLTKITISLKLYTNRNQFMFLQFGFYKLVFNKLMIYFTENLYLAFQFLKPNNTIIPLLDYLFVENSDITENALACNILNLNTGCIASIIKNQCIIIHSMNELFFTPNQLYFLSVETKKINDDNLI